MKRDDARGFTLLEVMIAVAILSMTVVVLVEMVTNNMRATHHARLTTAATFLARGKMIDVEDQIQENGFSTGSEASNGTFKDQSYPDFRWDVAIDAVELPAEAIQKQKDEQQDKNKDSNDPMSMLSGFIGGMMGSFIEPIRVGLQESVRRVTVHVTWDESGKPEQSIEVVQYLTDPSRLDAAMGVGIGGGAPGAGGASGSTTGSTSSTSSSSTPSNLSK
ncbi:MAG TPA: prepilin-type N-terminal cleavage/methylation domain-containing protein [Polyangia bacterium]|nr:prepilin-type N-terminal cleavage/methylation domain-containing protein [Polyangia bacterium]